MERNTDGNSGIKGRQQSSKSTILTVISVSILVVVVEYNDQFKNKSKDNAPDNCKYNKDKYQQRNEQ